MCLHFPAFVMLQTTPCICNNVTILSRALLHFFPLQYYCYSTVVMLEQLYCCNVIARYSYCNYCKVATSIYSCKIKLSIHQLRINCNQRKLISECSEAHNNSVIAILLCLYSIVCMSVCSAILDRVSVFVRVCITVAMSVFGCLCASVSVCICHCC